MHAFLVGALTAGVIFLFGLLFKFIGKRMAARDWTPEELENMGVKKKEPD